MMRYCIEPSLRSYFSKLHQSGKRFIEFTCSIKVDVEKDVEIIIYRTIVAILDKIQKGKVESVAINITSHSQISVVV